MIATLSRQAGRKYPQTGLGAPGAPTLTVPLRLQGTAGVVSGLVQEQQGPYYGGRWKRKRAHAERRDDLTAEEVQQQWELLELRKRNAAAARQKKRGEPKAGEAVAAPGPADRPKKPAPGRAVEALKIDADSLRVRKVLDDAQARAERDKDLIEVEELELMMLMAAAAAEDD